MTSLDEMAQVAADLRAVVTDIERLNTRIGGRRTRDPETGEIGTQLGSEGRYRKAWQQARATSKVNHPERTVADHNNVADSDAFDVWAAWTADKAELASAKEKAHSYRQILSGTQTATRVEAELSR